MTKGGNRPGGAEEHGLARWRGKVALVTGASSGIGAAIAEKLGGAGLHVVLTGRDRRRLERVAARVRAQGGAALPLVCDQTRLASSERILRRALRRWSPIDVLVNCAAVRGGRSVLDAPWTEVRDALDLNLAAPLWLMRAVVAQMHRSREGAVISISSLIAHRVTPGAPPVYAATKHALRILTDGLRAEIVARRLPIKVALVSPGLVDTPWHDDGLRTGRNRRLPHAALTATDVADAICYILAAPRGVQVSDVLLRSAGQVY